MFTHALVCTFEPESLTALSRVSPWASSMLLIRQHLAGEKEVLSLFSVMMEEAPLLCEVIRVIRVIVLLCDTCKLF